VRLAVQPPAVSAISTSIPRARRLAAASNITAPGSAPCLLRDELRAGALAQI
jgi:hypothetical protein